MPPCWPAAGPVHTALYGEAPGRLGADASGVPFWGDRAGAAAFGALAAAGCATLPPDPVVLTWTGAELRARGLDPVLYGVLLSNAYDCCPADERVVGGTRIRAPRPAELAAPPNRARIERELAAAHARGLRQVLAMGRVAEGVLRPLVATLGGVALVRVPHPSDQGLLMAAPGRGVGRRLADLRVAWQADLVARLRAAGDDVSRSVGGSDVC